MKMSTEFPMHCRSELDTVHAKCHGLNDFHGCNAMINKLYIYFAIDGTGRIIYTLWYGRRNCYEAVL